MLSLYHYLFFAFFLFMAGIINMLYRKNIIAILIGVELVLNACALNFIAYSKYVTKNFDGHIFALFIILVAAAEAAVALAIVIRFYQIKESIHIDDAMELQH